MDDGEKKILLCEAQRAQYFARAQLIYNMIPKLELSETIRNQFLSKSHTIDQLRTEYRSIVDKINFMQLSKDPDYIINFSSWDSFEDLYCEIKLALEKYTNTADSQQQHSSVRGNNCVKIPRIELPTFDGEIQNFPFFYETFKRMIHNNSNLTNSDKVHYLFSHLTGKAKSICAGVVPSAENYISVWETLITKYYDKRALGDTYLNQLLSMKPLSSLTAQSLENLIDKFAANISALRQLQIENLSEFIFVHLGLKLLDSETAKHFEMSIRSNKDMPNYDEFVSFVREQAKILNRTSQPRLATKASTSSYQRASHSHITTQSSDNIKKCPLCKSSSHSKIADCNKFLKLSREDKYKCVKENNWCSNCLGTQHWASKCLSKYSCRKCNKRHHVLLHIDNYLPPQSVGATAVKFNSDSDSSSSAINENNLSVVAEDNKVSLCTMSSITCQDKHPTTEILGTATILAVGRKGNDISVRCLLDPGSQKHYVTTRCVRKLGLVINRGLSALVRGIGGSSQPVKGSVNLSFRSRVNTKKEFCINALVLDDITAKLPTCVVDVAQISGFEHIPLADEAWGSPAEVDLLIGVELFADLLLPGKVINSPGFPNAIETLLGYVVFGNAPIKTVASSSSSLSFCATFEVDQFMKKFWELEDFGNKPPMSLDEIQAEKLYKSTVKRDDSGRYEVALPFKLNPDLLGKSHHTAMRRYLNLERKLKSNLELKSMYDNVIKEHIDKRYLSEVEMISDKQAYYIPHHAVLRDDKSTTKLRVVLDASSATDTSYSLNDVLHTGPTLQADLFHILLNFRLFPVAISGDVRQMYLAIEVREEDRSYQRILYRFNPDEPIKVFEYNRVAFGLRCSPFLALRTVQQLITDEGDKFPRAKEIASRDIYMDDIVSSILDVTTAVDSVHELIGMFMTGGFQLTKWSSNSVRVLEGIPEELRVSQSVTFDNEDTLKILGLRWYPTEDIFVFHVTQDERSCTKRHILSYIARLFDVLGLVAPIILFAKLLIKDLWTAKVEWDEVPPKHIIRKWDKFRRELPLISKLKFPRHIGVVENCSLTLLGFADASEKAYGGVVYAVTTTPDNRSCVTLICAKSKVAPLKVVSLARLELCGLLVLAQLIRKVIDNYSSRYHIESVYAFSDSIIALSWTHSEPYRWQTFVANRVAKIQENLNSDHFFYVKGTDNPSDCLSRGLTPAQLINHPLWFKGPPWASLPRESWPIRPFLITDECLPEIKAVALVSTNIANENLIYKLSNKFSSWNKYVHCVVYVLKFMKKLPKGPIIATDLDIAENLIFRSLQQVYFSHDMNDLKAGRLVSNNLKQLKPFMDNGIIRVGGRLGNSNESYEYRHQILLPRRDHIIEILIDYYHRKNCHAGPEMLMSLLRRRFWIISARRIIRQGTRKCNMCFRYKPHATSPMMADLHSSRVNPVEKAFSHTGCDYAGPILYTPQRRRGVKSQKAYLCIFSCLTTRAIHIELATDLSTVSFLAAFKRFLARRGPVKSMQSDNATNFVGAKSYLQELHKFLAEKYKQHWETELAENRITWKMICPSAPHHGGNWETFVKSVKSHLFRSVGEQVLSYEELLTVLTQVESLLNSRPLYTLSSDPSEPTALSPAHFLHTIPLKYLPSAELDTTSDHLLKRHELLDKIVQSFWKRWMNEYLHTLQSRRKWNTPAQPIREGMVVIVMQDNVMPLHWPLGVIIETFPGRDGVIRIAKVKTKTGIYQRPVVKLCPLPTQ